MGLERLLFGVSGFHSRKVTLAAIQHGARKACTFAQTSLRTELRNRQGCVSALCGNMFLHTGRHGQPIARRGLSSSGQLSKDITLFEHDRTRFFRLLSFFCGGQFIFWSYLAHFAYTGLRNTKSATQTGKDKTSSRSTTTTAGLPGVGNFNMNLGSNAWRYGFTVACLAIGGAIVSCGTLFCLRSVSKVVLHRGGKTVTVYTQSPLGRGRGRKITVPLSEVACYSHRQETASFIPLKVKGHQFYYLLDKEGTLTNGRLFDTTVGAYRSF